MLSTYFIFEQLRIFRLKPYSYNGHCLNCKLSPAVFLQLIRVYGFAAEKAHGVEGGSYHTYCGTPFEHRHQEEEVASANIIVIFPVQGWEKGNKCLIRNRSLEGESKSGLAEGLGGGEKELLYSVFGS